MDLFSQDISRLVFRSNIRRDMGQVSLSAVMLEVLRELDGNKTTLAVSRSLQMSMSTLRDVLSHLHRFQLIEVVEGRREVADRKYLKTIESHLADVMGPMAGVLIRDAIKDMGEEAGMFPKVRSEELIERLASKIFVDAKREVFLRAAKAL